MLSTIAPGDLQGGLRTETRKSVYSYLVVSLWLTALAMTTPSKLLQTQCSSAKSGSEGLRTEFWNSERQKRESRDEDLVSKKQFRGSPNELLESKKEFREAQDEGLETKEPIRKSRSGALLMKIR